MATKSTQVPHVKGKGVSTSLTTVWDQLADLPDDALLTTSEAAVFLRSSDAKLECMRKDGIGPAYGKDGGAHGAIQYRKRDLLDWLAAVKMGGKVR